MTGGPKINLGISSCLLGENVRYNGENKLNLFLKNLPRHIVEFYPLCPEVECGLTIPREPANLMGNADSPRFVTVNSNIDHTDCLTDYIQKKLTALEEEKLCGFIFKSKSPSCGLSNVNIYHDDSSVTPGSGLFAGAFVKKYPFIPVIEECDVGNRDLWQAFVIKIIINHRFRQIQKNGLKHSHLKAFHARNKQLICLHSVSSLQKLENILDNPDIESIFHDYLFFSMECLEQQLSESKNIRKLFETYFHPGPIEQRLFDYSG